MTARTTTAPSMRARFAETATTLLDTDRRIVVLTAVIGAAAFHDAKLRHPHRVVDVGIREQLLISTAAGFALEGFRPIAHSYTPFLIERPYEQLKLDLSHQGAGAILVSTGASYDASSEGRTHQAPADVAVVAALPDWQIYVPGHADELEHALQQAAARNGNVYIRMSTQSNGRPQPLDGITIVRRGSAGAPLILAIGPMLDPTLEATTGLDVAIAYTASVRPLDAAGLAAAATGTDVAVVEPYLEGTTAAAVSAALVDRPHRILSIGVGATELRNYGSPSEHAAAHGLDSTGIRRRITRFMND